MYELWVFAHTIWALGSLLHIGPDFAEELDHDTRLPTQRSMGQRW